MQEIQFDYYRGMEAEQYTFYRIPKILFTAEYFRGLSCEAKVLYGLLLDRMGLSIKNRWFDEEDRVYIIFTVEAIAELMNCGTQKAVKLLKELDTDKGIGLVEKKRLGLGKPNIIYVKNFIIRQTDDRELEEQQVETSVNTQNGENHNSKVVKITNFEFPESQSRNCENHNLGIMKNTIPESPKSPFQNCENHNSGMVKTTIQEFSKSQSNDTDINKTDLSDTEFNETEHPIYPNLIPSVQKPVLDMMEQMDAYREIIRENISYGCFQDNGFHRKEELDELVELMVEVMLTPDEKNVRIAGAEKPAAVVRNRFMKLRHEHMEYILACLRSNTTKVGNIKSYLLTTLYNAPVTISNYYTAEVNHDLYRGG